MMCIPYIPNDEPALLSDDCVLSRETMEKLQQYAWNLGGGAIVSGGFTGNISISVNFPFTAEEIQQRLTKILDEIADE